MTLRTKAREAAGWLIIFGIYAAAFVVGLLLLPLRPFLRMPHSYDASKEDGAHG